MNTTALHRLAWKELRTLRALWLSILAMGFAMQLGLALLTDRPYVRSEWVFSIGLFVPVVYAFASSAVAFAGEREEGTDQVLSRLAVPPLALLCGKALIGLLSTAVLLVILYSAAWVLSPWQSTWDLWHARGSLSSIRMQALAWGLGLYAWGLFFSLMFRRVLPCLLVATAATVLTPIAVSAFLDLLPSRQAHSESLDWTLRLAVIPGLLLVISSRLVQTWDEDRWPRLIEWLLAWSRAKLAADTQTDISDQPRQKKEMWRAIVRPFGLCQPDEWLPAWRREARRLLWLEFRQARRLMLIVMVAFALYLVGQALLVTGGRQLLPDEFPFVLALVAFIFGVWSFQVQQSEQQYRGFARHGASPTAMWFIKQTVCLGMMLCTALGLTAVTMWLFNWGGGTLEQLVVKLAYGIQWQKITGWIDPQWLREGMSSLCINAMLALGLCFAAGQFVSLLISRAVTAPLVGFLLAAIALGWQQLTAHLAIPSGLAVLPLIIGLLLATFVRMSDWLEERNTVRGWLKVALALGVPSLVTLIGVPLYRVWEIPKVDAEWQRRLDAAKVPPSLSAKQTAQAWIRVAESIDDEPVFRWLQREKPDGAADEIEVEREYSPTSFVARTKLTTWANLKNPDWVTRHANALAQAAQIAREPDCAFDPRLFDGSDRSEVRADYTFRQISRLAVLLTMAAESALSEGRLENAFQHTLTLYRFSRHMQQHGGSNAVFTAEKLELIAWSLLLDWARHPAQTGDSLQAAMGRTAGAAEHPLREVLFPDFKQSIRVQEAVAADYVMAKENLKSRWKEEPWLASWLVCERLREERLLDYSAFAAVSKLEKFTSEGSSIGWGESRFIREIPHWEQGDRTDFLRATTRSLNFNWAEQPGNVSQRANERGETELCRRALILTLALRAFYLDHGHWPAHWDELVGQYVDRISVDPWTGQPLDYRPQGYPFDVKIGGHLIRASTPLFLSGGPYQQHFVPTARRAKGDETTSQVQWLLVHKHGVTNWPLERDDYALTSIVAFPLDAIGP